MKQPMKPELSARINKFMDRKIAMVSDHDVLSKSVDRKFHVRQNAEVNALPYIQLAVR